MSNEILVPSLGESVSEATVSKWLKQEGEKVDSDEPLVELETDKVNVEVPSPVSGVLSSIKAKEGDTVEVGTLLGVVSEGKSTSIKTKNKTKTKTKTIEQEDTVAEASDQKPYIPPKKVKEKENNINVKNSEDEETLVLLDEKKNVNKIKPLILETLVETDMSENKNLIEEEKKKFIPPKKKNNLSPSVRKIIEEQNIDISNVQGTGKEGRISKGDLINLMGSTPEPSKRKETHGVEERVKMTRLRLTIAKRLKEAQENAAMLTTFNEVDMSEVISMRNQYKEEFQKNMK